MENYTKIKNIGKGNYGKATLCLNKLDNKTYVLKSINTAQFNDEQVHSALFEVELLKRLNHPYIIKYIDSFFYQEYLIIVMEHAECGDLNKFIKEQKKLKLPLREEVVMNWFVQICFAVKYIHDRKILHRDLKLSNIFLSINGDIKLGDFGISKVLENTTEYAYSVVGTPYYLSPEICLKKPYNHKSDIWSLGCLLYELVMLKHAFDGNNIGELCLKILKGEYEKINKTDDHFKKYYNINIVDLIEELLSLEPDHRPNIDQVLENKCLFKYIKVNLIRQISNSIKEEKESNLNNNNNNNNNQFNNTNKELLFPENLDMNNTTNKISESIASTYRLNNIINNNYNNNNKNINNQKQNQLSSDYNNNSFHPETNSDKNYNQSLSTQSKKNISSKNASDNVFEELDFNYARIDISNNVSSNSNDNSYINNNNQHQNSGFYNYSKNSSNLEAKTKPNSKSYNNNSNNISNNNISNNNISNNNISNNNITNINNSNLNPNNISKSNNNIDNISNVNNKNDHSSEQTNRPSSFNNSNNNLSVKDKIKITINYLEKYLGKQQYDYIYSKIKEYYNSNNNEYISNIDNLSNLKNNKANNSSIDNSIENYISSNRSYKSNIVNLNHMENIEQGVIASNNNSQIDISVIIKSHSNNLSNVNGKIIKMISNLIKLENQS